MELAGGGSGGPCVFECLRLSKAVRASGLELTLSVVSGGSVEVYNCATGSADCSQCLGREDLGHRCLWSESSSSCRLQTEPPQVPEVCPPPEIRKVRPEGSMEGVCGVTWGDVGVVGVGWGGRWCQGLGRAALSRVEQRRICMWSLAQDGVRTRTGLFTDFLCC